MSSRRSRTDRMGSHQSEAEVDQIAAEQPALLAAATARKSSNKKVPKDARVGKKLFTFPKAKEQTSWKAGRRRSGKTSPASFSLVKAKYMKGDKADQFTGRIYFHGKPRFGHNDLFKKKVQPKLLKHPLRWNEEMKVYRAEVHQAKQAEKVLEAMKTVSAEDEADLEDAVVDSTIFDDANSADISLFEMEVDGKMMACIAGCTFPWGDELTERGFKYYNDIDGRVVQMWAAPTDTVDFDELQSLFEEYGFPVTIFDGVDDSDDAE